MDFGTIIKSSLKYPFEDKKTWLIMSAIALVIPIILVGLLATTHIYLPTTIDEARIVANNLAQVMTVMDIVFVILGIVFNGIGYEIMRNALNNRTVTEKLNAYDILKHGLGFFIIELVYGIIIAILCMFLLMLIFLTPALNIFLSNGVMVFIGVIMLAIMNIISLTHYANTQQIDHAFKFGEIASVVDNIGWLNIVAYSIIMAIISFLIILVLLLICLIPYIGIFISATLGYTYLMMVGMYGQGLVYKSRR